MKWARWIRWERHKRVIVGAGLAVALAVVVAAGLGHRWAGEHVRYMSGNESASLECAGCHLYTKREGVLGRLFQRDYLSPLDIAVAPDGRRVYVTAEEGGALLVVDVSQRRVVRAIEVGRRPHSVVVARDGKTAYVSNRWSNTVSVVDLAADSVTREFEVGGGPAGLALGGDGVSLYVANSFSDDISILDLPSGVERRRLAAGRNPYAVTLSPGGGTVYVANRLSNLVPFQTPPVTEVTMVGTRPQRVVRRVAFPSANVIEGIDVTPSGDLVLTTLTRPKNLIPATQVERGWMYTFGIGVVEPGREGRVAQFLLDDVNAFYADPYDVVITPDGGRAFVSHSGADVVTVVDLDSLRAILAAATPESLTTYADDLGLSSRYVLTRIPTGANPKGLALSPDGRRLYVAERLADRIAVIDTHRFVMVDSIDLGGPKKETFVRRGQKLFHSARQSFQGQFSCRSCHPDGHSDALSYDLEPDGLGRNIVNNISLLDVGGSAPYKWSGKNASLYRQCGFRFAKWLTRTETYPEKDLYALVAYILSLPRTPNRHRDASGKLTPAQGRGKEIFDRAVTTDGRIIPPGNRCITCHPPPLFTNRRMADVGTAGPTDTEREFDTPRLDNLSASAPYLHDGRAATLEEIWTVFNPDDTHGVVNDLTKAELNDLIEYLKALGGQPAPRRRTP
ncbi:MAG: hypothetical protein ACE5HQ_10730 [Gemmatimonadota bacterium]